MHTWASPVYTVTLNPSIDCVMGLDSWEQGAVNRAKYQMVLCGGKGVNVSLLLTRLGVPNTALGFAAGFTGDALLAELARLGVYTDFIRLSDGLTRINVKLKSERETEINGAGAAPDAAAMACLREKLAALPAGSVLVLSGSLPAGLPDDTYAGLIAALDGQDVSVVLDASGASLKQALSCRPFLVKPNGDELGALLGRKIRTRDEAAACAGELKVAGARNVLVSLAGEGAVLLDETGAVHASAAPRGTVRSSVGAGDSMIAGFLTGWLRSGDYETALRCGVAAGSATAFSYGIAQAGDVEAQLRALGERRILF